MWTALTRRNSSFSASTLPVAAVAATNLLSHGSDMRTRVLNALLRPMSQDDEGGAQTTLYAATVKGVRDITSGVLGLALLIFVGAEAGAWFMLASALSPLGDMVIVLRHGGTKAVAFGVHLATAAVVLISATLLFAL